MKFVIVSKDWCYSHGIILPSQTRTNIAGDKVILHKDFINPILREEDNIESYEHDSKELNDILNSKEWTNKEEIL